MTSLDPLWQLAAALVGDRDPLVRVDGLLGDLSAGRPVRISAARLPAPLLGAAAAAIARQSGGSRRVSDVLAHYHRHGLVRAVARMRARQLGAPPAVLHAADHALGKWYAAVEAGVGDLTVAQSFERLSRLVADVSRASARSLDGEPGGDEVTIEPGDGGVDVHFPGGSKGGIIIGIIMAILLGAAAIFAQREDHTAREALNALSCEEVVATSDEELEAAFKILLGLTSTDLDATANRDEQSMLRVLGCLPAARVRNILEKIEARMLSRYEGPELTQLTRVLLDKGPMRIGGWGPGLSRKFIRAAAPGVLSALDAAACRLLFIQLFNGWTGELDEAVAVTLLASMTCTEISAMVVQTGARPSDFRRNLNGREQRTAEDIFKRCGVK